MNNKPPAIIIIFWIVFCLAVFGIYIAYKWAMVMTFINYWF